MLIRVASDLHLEFFPRESVEALTYHFLPPDDRDSEAVLVLAGDISAQPLQLLEFLRYIEGRFLHVVYVPGNHEYYRHNFDEWNAEARAAFVLLRRFTGAVNRVAVADVAGLRFIACTLWGSGGATKAEQRAVADGLHDFRMITIGSRKFDVADMAVRNRQQRWGIGDALGRSDGPVVVVTHHLPSFQLCHPRFGTLMNGGFASDCEALMEDPRRAPVLWIHGHTHDTIDTQIGRTRVVCNPAGYQPEWGTPFNAFLSRPLFVEVPTP